MVSDLRDVTCDHLCCVLQGTQTNSGARCGQVGVYSRPCIQEAEIMEAGASWMYATTPGKGFPSASTQGVGGNTVVMRDELSLSLFFSKQNKTKQKKPEERYITSHT